MLSQAAKRKIGRELTSSDGRWYAGGAGKVATMLSASPTVSTMSARVVPLVVAGLRAAKADVATVLSRLGVSDAEPLDSDTRISHALAFDLFEAAVEVTGDQAFGLHAAEQLRPGTLGTVDYLVRCSPTLGEALLRARRYQRLIQDADLCLEACAGRASQRYALSGGLPLPRPAAECVLAGAVVWARQLTGRALNPLEVRFAHKRPRDTTEQERLFQARLRFGTGENAVVFPAAVLDMPLVHADIALMRILEHHAQELLARLPAVDSLRSRVRGLLAAELQRGKGRLDHIGALLHMSARTLRRRLRDEGTSASEVLDEMRRDLAVGYLRQDVSVGEIAFTLGFSDGSAFHKAFRRWTGQSPAQYRRYPSDRGSWGRR